MRVLNVGIVGGGVAGCYCAYRLASARKFENIELFEVNQRLGGRLWSVPVEGIPGEPIELGGNFIGALHHNLFGLIEQLNLETVQLKWSAMKPVHSLLRGTKQIDFTKSFPGVPFKLQGKEIGKDPSEILDATLSSILDTDVTSLWPRNNAAHPRTTIEALKNSAPRGRPLWEWGFWNLLAEMVSNEAYALLLADAAATSNFSNSNAFDAIWLILMEDGADRRCFKIKEGYDKLPRALIDQADQGIPVNLEARLTRVDRQASQLLLTFDERGAETQVLADHAILALPPTALKQIAFGAGVVTDRFFHDVDAVEPVPACKLYLVFENAWWDYSELGPGALTENDVRLSKCDLPMRRCFFYGRPLKGERALMLAAFADDVAASFWAGLMPSEAHEIVGEKWVRAPIEMYGAANMVQAARHQLRQVYGDIVPEPLPPIFINWRDTPSGAGWHSWKPHRKSWEVRKRLRRPNPELGLYVCGEAFAQLPGWVEGAINSAEMALAPFALDSPKWVTDPKFEFEYEI